VPVGEPMTDDDRFRLLFGPYRAPPLRRGDRALCLFRDAPVAVTSWTDAPIPWPRCRALDGRGGGSGLLVEEELARAVRTESALAVRFWWGVNHGTVARWRKALGVDGYSPPGTRRLRQAASEAGADALRGKQLPPEQVGRRRRTARELGLWRTLQPGYHGPRWTEGQLRLLGTDTDEAVAALVGRTPAAVRVKRTRLGIPAARDRRRKGMEE